MKNVIEILIALIIWKELPKISRYIRLRFNPEIFFFGITFRNWRNVGYKDSIIYKSGNTKTYTIGKRINK